MSCGNSPCAPCSTNGRSRSHVNRAGACVCVEHVGQQRFGGHPRVGAHRQRAPVRLAGNVLDEALQQRAHDVRRVLGPKRARLVVSSRFGEQRQRQRMAMGEGQHRRVLRLRQAARVQVGAAVARLQVAQRQHVGELAPGRVGAPARAKVGVCRRALPAPGLATGAETARAARCRAASVPRRCPPTAPAALHWRGHQSAECPG